MQTIPTEAVFRKSTITEPGKYLPVSSAELLPQIHSNVILLRLFVSLFSQNCVLYRKIL